MLRVRMGAHATAKVVSAKTGYLGWYSSRSVEATAEN